MPTVAIAHLEMAGLRDCGLSCRSNRNMAGLEGHGDGLPALHTGRKRSSSLCIWRMSGPNCSYGRVESQTDGYSKSHLMIQTHLSDINLSKTTDNVLTTMQTFFSDTNLI
jgi:hypothetical protein